MVAWLTSLHSALTALYAQPGRQEQLPRKLCNTDATIEAALLELVILGVQVILLVRGPSSVLSNTP